MLAVHLPRISSLEGLASLSNLDTLNLSINIIESLAGVGRLKSLSNLYISRNLIRQAKP